MNPTQWLQAYATVVHVTGGDTNVMANYLPIMLTPAATSWFTSLAPESIGSWEELKKVFTDNYVATCTRPSTKHGLNRITQKPSECNTPGVCHQLSNGFKLNHGMLSGDGDVRSNI